MSASLSDSNISLGLTPEEQEELALVLDDYLGKMEQGAAPELEAVCGEHPKLAALIRRYAKSLEFLRGATYEARRSESTERSVHEVPSKEIGDYRLIREVGRGGMGVVYEAQQISLGRRVALKILPFAAVLDPRQITRFQNEAQAAAQLHHPNIVPVYAIGSDRGTYFYSMQYIDGQSLDYAIADLQRGNDTWNRLARGEKGFPDPHRNATTLVAPTTDPLRSEPVTESLQKANTVGGNLPESTLQSIRTRNHVERVAELGVQAAEALHYAHQNGIVHRDIKPSNLLVDQHGKLWITDFGLAQCGRLGNLTRSGDVIGTLRYMSPEQATGKTHWIDNRTDIYSLGLTLYELLTLRPVVDGTDRMVMLRQIEGSEPKGARHWNPAVPIDFENILLKAIAKQREDRYATAGEFAEDLKRYLSGKTPLARRPTLMDRSARWVASHARGVALGCLLLISLLILTAIIASLLGTKNRAILEANVRSERHLQVAHTVVDRFGAQLLTKLDLLPGSEELQREVAQNSIDYLNAFAEYASHEPARQQELGRALLKLATIHEMRGSNAEAFDAYRRAESMLAPPSNSNGSVLEVTPDLFACWNNLGCLMTRMGMLDDATKRFQTYLQSIELANRTAPIELDLRARWVALLRLNLGYVYRERGELRSAAAEFDQAIAELRASSVPTKNNIELRQMTVTALLQASAGTSVDMDRSLQLLEIALSTSELSARERPDDPVIAHEVCVCQLALGSACMPKDPTKAKVFLERGTSDLRRLALKHPGNTRLWNDYASGLNNLGQAELETDALMDAKAAFEESKRVLERLMESTSDYMVACNLGGVLNNLASIAESRGNLREAQRMLTKAIEIQKRAIAAAPESKRSQEFLRQHESNLVRVDEKLAQSSESSATK